MTYDPQHPTTPPPPVPPPAPAGRTPRWPLVTAGVASLVAVVAVVGALVAVSGSTAGTVTEAADKIKESAEAAKAKGYTIREGVCTKIDTDEALGDWVKLDEDGLTEQVVELSGLECRAYGAEVTDGSVTILVATHEDDEAAEKALERRKGEIYTDSWADVEGTDWDQAQYAASRIGAPSLLVQHQNLNLVVEVSASEKKTKDFGDEAEKVMVKVAKTAIKAVSGKPK